MVNHLVRQYHETDAETRRLGETWYPSVNRWAEEVAAVHEVPTSVVVGMLAAYSPRLPWARNQAVVLQHLRYRGEKPTGTFERSFLKAKRILNNEPVDLVLTGPKEWRFYLSIMGPMGPWACIDIWAIRAAMPFVTDAKDEKQATENRRNGRRITSWIEDAYLLAAERVGVPAPAFQATIWVAVRGSAV
jgi:hypothetical protein